MANQYRKKPVVITAVQWNGINVQELMDLAQKAHSGTTLTIDITVTPPRVTVKTLEIHSDPLEASVGDWLIMGVKGELYPCKPDIFAATYDQVVEEPAEVVGVGV